MFTINFTWCVIVLSLLFSQISEAALVIGGFDAGRVGPGHLAGEYTEEVREAITSAFPGATFVETSVLSPDFLQSVDVLIMGAPSLIGAVPISSDEQRSLLDFVKAGGGALIYSDNNDYAGQPASDDANETFLDPFDVNITGKLRNLAFATVTNLEHPVVNGPFGQVTTFTGYFPGWFDGVGSYATTLAIYNVEAERALLAIEPGAIAPRSGGVVFLSDADILIDSADGGYFGLVDNRPLILNSIEYVTAPEPSVLSACLCCLFVFFSRRRRTA